MTERKTNRTAVAELEGASGGSSPAEKGGANAAPAEKGNGLEPPEALSSVEDLKKFLRSVLDKMSDDQAAPVYSLALMNHLLNLPTIYSLLDNENKELARDIWLRLKASGVQLRNPPLLFGGGSETAGS
jgi:hypothetical protein